MSLLPDLWPHFSRFLDAAPDRLHAAADSHHYWPDVTFAAQQRCWEDAASLADGKWARVLGDVLPTVQGGVADLLGLPDSNTLAFAPNTHEFVVRLLSCLPAAPRILTTDGEFHSFARQVRRLEEAGLAVVERVPVLPYPDFTDRFATAAAEGGFDLVFVSQVFFDSGYAVDDIEALVAAVPDADTLVVIDGYHGFLARPTDLGAIADRAVYLSGGYKYAMAGEGVCFLHCPPGYGARPRNTGWYAAFDAVTEAGGGVSYAEDGRRFLGATFDPVGLYRLRAVLAWLTELKIGPRDIHVHVQALQARFLDGLDGLECPGGSARLHPDQLLVPDAASRGNFLAFHTVEAPLLHEQLAAANVVVDYRGDRLRIGFGLYHQPDDIDRLLDRLGRVLRGG